MKPLIIANWKMNPPTSRDAFVLAREVAKEVGGLNARVVLCPPFTFIPQLLPVKNVRIGAQNCSWQNSGPLTGEVSPVQLRNLGCSHVILGHSERKKELGETLGMVAKKAKAAKKTGLIAVLCVENTAELRSLKKKMGSFKGMVIVFEPFFAISTKGGKRVAPEIIAKTIREMKKVAGNTTPFLYGGSVGAASIATTISEGNVQGALVGAASLNAKEFVKLVKNAVSR
ncbi:MAG: triose-phosphate isomerase family protein [bacterium]|nr:triose-phosphate isomerase family protein [bacterium]